jgi:nicotinate-nucleotide adenylyltransferase
VKLAILGGSFNPIHLGHLYLADSVLSAFSFDHLILVPANISPFKQHLAGQVPGGCHFAGQAADGHHSAGQDPEASETAQSPASPQDRLDMILASVTGDPRISVDPLELHRGGVSYTIDTLEDIIDRYRPEQKPALILGDDLGEGFSRWKRAEEIARRADILIARRIPPSGDRVITEFPFPHRSLDNEVMEISSAMVRDRIARDGAWHYLVPRGARLIIEERGLYKPSPDRSGGAKKAAGSGKIGLSRIARVEDAAREALSPSRFIHSRNTAVMARDLARRGGLDQGAAYLAGIAHDMAKPLNKRELLVLAEQDERGFSALEQKNPGLLHGRAAAVLLQKYFGIHNRDVLEAVAFHTTGKRDMSDLAKAVFIADKIEFSREGVSAPLRDLAGRVSGSAGLGDLFYRVAEHTLHWLKKEGLEAAEETLRLLDQGKKTGGIHETKNQG